MSHSKKKTVIVGTYNMSWASDTYTNKDEMEKDKGKISEYSFLLKNKDPNVRKFWENAKDNLEKFITEKKPIAVGLQEMNLTTSGNTGSKAIDAILPSNYTQHCEEVQSKFSKDNSNAAKVGISIIWDKTKLGNINRIQIVDNINQTGFIKGGRPILMILTTEKYLLINMHGAQDPTLGTKKSEFNAYMLTNNRTYLMKTVKTFLGQNTIISDIFVMGDFNDRYDAIADFLFEGITVKYNGESPYSCCHNWDSSCSDDRYTFFVENEKEKEKDYGYCKDPNPPPADKKTEIPDEEVKVKNYRYKGDKVFGQTPVGQLEMFNSKPEEVSSRSDHELVFGTFTMSPPIKNGGRRMISKKKMHSRKRYVKRRNTRKRR
jgi:hypothetical protein